MWSHAVQHALNNGAPVGEVHLVGRTLLEASRTGDGEAWYRAWHPLAERTRDAARVAEEEGRAVTARGAYRRATIYFELAERFLPFDDDRRAACFSEAVEAFHRACALSRPLIETVEVPYEAGSLPAYFLPAHADPPWPAVLMFNGLDGSAENLAMRAEGLAERGLACLVMDGPGYGLSLRVRGIRARHDHEVASAAAIDYLETRADVDARRIGIVASSLGGYYASRSAAFEPRIRAAVAWGAVWDYQKVWLGRREVSVASPLASPQRQICWILGVETLDEAIERLSAWKLEQVAPRIRCPFLVVHGENDRQIPLADAQRLYEAAGSLDKQLVVFRPSQGGDEHCQVDNPGPAKDYIYDWLAWQLGAGGRPTPPYEEHFRHEV